MPVKIRLTRQGRKKRPYYHIVVSDSRAPRDGRFIEKLGNYDPGTNPATIEIDFEKSLQWVLKGAQPTDTCRAILSYKGVMYKKHLVEGVRKNAFSEEEAEKKFSKWLTEKEAKIQSKISSLDKKKADSAKKRLEHEAKVNEERAKAIAKKNAKLAESAAEKAEDHTTEVESAVEAVESPVAETPAATITEVPSEAPVAEAAAEEAEKPADSEQKETEA
jgi:small subunit ribosomal protein S16